VKNNTRNFLERYPVAFFIAVVLHLAVFLVLFSHYKKPVRKVHLAASKPVKIVEAIAVDQSEVNAVVSKIKAQAKAKRQKKIKTQREYQKKLQAAKTKRIQEQKRLAKLKKQQALAAKRLKNIKKQNKILVEKQKKIKEQQVKQAKLDKKLKLKKKREKEALAKRKQLAALKEKKHQAQKQIQRQIQMQGEINKYQAMILQSISHHWLLPDNANKHLACEFFIRLAPGGTVLDVKLLKSSGNPALDRSAKIAVYKASPFPVPKDKETFERMRTIHLTMRPEEIISQELTV